MRPRIEVMHNKLENDMETYVLFVALSMEENVESSTGPRIRSLGIN